MSPLFFEDLVAWFLVYPQFSSLTIMKSYIAYCLFVLAEMDLLLFPWFWSPLMTLLLSASDCALMPLRYLVRHKLAF